MIIKREQFLQELELREQIRKVIRVVKKKKALSEGQEEEKLRMVIRQLLAEQEDIEPSPDRPTGIRILDEEVLQNIVPIFEKYYKQLAKPEQRESFRTHIINAVENLLATISSGLAQAPAAQAPGSEVPMLAAPPEEMPAAPPPVMAEQAAPGGSPKDDPRFIDVRNQPSPEEEDRSSFRTGIETDLSPDAEIGAERAQIAFNGPDTTIEKAYKTLRGEDATLFAEYLITNLKLHFDAFEEELSLPEEPTTPSYDEAAAGPPPGMGPPPELGMSMEEPMPPGPGGPMPPMV